jgi:hypothetical protein
MTAHVLALLHLGGFIEFSVQLVNLPKHYWRRQDEPVGLTVRPHCSNVVTDLDYSTLQAPVVCLASTLLGSVDSPKSNIMRTLLTPESTLFLAVMDLYSTQIYILQLSGQH